MSVHLDIALQRLKKSLLELAAFVEDQVRQSLIAFNTRNDEVGKEVIAKDNQIDQIEIDIEENCLQILALYQPVAQDLRFVISVLKINNDLERIGDLAVNIAERASALCAQAPVQEPLVSEAMEQRVLNMLTSCIDCFVRSDINVAKSVCRSDLEIDKAHQANYRRLEELIAKSPHMTEILLQHLSLSRYLERIADLATNIAEDVIYLAEGKIVRHRQRFEVK
ncbi:MAG: phosphate signaling complex protein PhoU [Bdellovibrionota bacterium]